MPNFVKKKTGSPGENVENSKRIKIQENANPRISTQKIAENLLAKNVSQKNSQNFKMVTRQKSPPPPVKTYERKPRKTKGGIFKKKCKKIIKIFSQKLKS